MAAGARAWKRMRRGIVPLLAVAGVVLAACGSEATAPENLPADHTVRYDGASHAPGAKNAEATCTVCHGGDLRGGQNGEPSCFTCHGKEWD